MTLGSRPERLAARPWSHADAPANVGGQHSAGMMCRTYAARVMAIEGDDAVVEGEGRQRRASLLLEPSVRVGDTVLVGAGRVIRRITPREAAELEALLRPPLPTGPRALEHRSPGGLS